MIWIGWKRKRKKNYYTVLLVPLPVTGRTKICYINIPRCNLWLFTVVVLELTYITSYTGYWFYYTVLVYNKPKTWGGVAVVQRMAVAAGLERTVSKVEYNLLELLKFTGFIIIIFVTVDYRSSVWSGSLSKAY